MELVSPTMVASNSVESTTGAVAVGRDEQPESAVVEGAPAAGPQTEDSNRILYLVAPGRAGCLGALAAFSRLKKATRRYDEPRKLILLTKT